MAHCRISSINIHCILQLRKQTFTRNVLEGSQGSGVSTFCSAHNVLLAGGKLGPLQLKIKAVPLDFVLLDIMARSVEAVRPIVYTAFLPINLVFGLRLVHPRKN